MCVIADKIAELRSFINYLISSNTTKDNFKPMKVRNQEYVHKTCRSKVADHTYEEGDIFSDNNRVKLINDGVVVDYFSSLFAAKLCKIESKDGVIVSCTTVSRSNNITEITTDKPIFAWYVESTVDFSDYFILEKTTNTLKIEHTGELNIFIWETK